MQEIRKQAVADAIRGFADSLAKTPSRASDILEMSVRYCAQAVNAQSCSVWLADPERRALRLHAAYGYAAAITSAHRLMYSIDSADHAQGLTPWIYTSRESFSADSYADMIRHPAWRGRYDALNFRESPLSSNHPCQQFYGTPISIGPECLGVLKVENKANIAEQTTVLFSDSDKAFIDALAGILGVALRYASPLEHDSQFFLKYVEDAAKRAVSAISSPTGGLGQESLLWLPQPDILVVDEWMGIARRISEESAALFLLDWRRFEDLIGNLLRESGWEVTPMGYTKDGGVDIVAVRKTAPDIDFRMIVQCKKYAQHRKIGVAPVRELFAVKSEQSYSQAMIATSSTFTKGAEDKAEFWKMELRDHDAIVNWCRRYANGNLRNPAANKPSEATSQ